MAFQDIADRIKTITGFFLPDSPAAKSNQEDGLESEEEEEEDQQPEFLDMNEMESEGNLFTSPLPKSKQVSILVGENKYRVEGRFPLCDPWWEVTCTVSRGKYKTWIRGSPFYKLRTDLGPEGRSIVALFLKACKATPEFVTMFVEWLPKDRNLELVALLDFLQDFQESSPQNEAAAKELISNVKCSDAWKHIRVANSFPYIMQYLPTLLPKQFLELSKKGQMKEPAETSQREEPSPENPEDPEDKHKNLLDKLEELMKTDVWKLGFNYIVFKELNLVRCEAKLESFQQCGLFSTLAPLHRIALVLYEKIKRFCRTCGSTYCTRKMLEKDAEIGGVWEALHFLVKQEVLVIERNMVALRNLYWYEKGIAICIRGLIHGDPLKIRLDVRDVLRNAQIKRLQEKAKEAEAKLEADTKVDLQPNKLHNGAAYSQSPHSKLTRLSIKEDTVDPEFSEDPPGLEIDPDSIELDPDQVRAAEMICANPVTVISGKGGCGKTTVVSLVFKADMQQKKDQEEMLMACEDFKNESGNMMCSEEVYKEKKDAEESVRILLTAPTGRAASLLTKKTGFTAYTMHQVLWSFMTFKKNQTEKPWKFSKVQVLVVDEGSLVSVQILHSLLSMLSQHAQLQKFILLGDVRQLPSIEPGNTLCNLFEGLRRARWAIEMQTNHRAESELIVKNAVLISEMQKKRPYRPLEFDAVVDMKNLSTVGDNKRFIFVRISGRNDSFDMQDAIQFLLHHAPGLQDDKHSQFVAFRRKDCELINELCCKHYSKHATKTFKNKSNFQPRDKVCCTKNGNVKDHGENQEEKTQASQDKAVIVTQNSKNKLNFQSRDKVCFTAHGNVKDHEENQEEKTQASQDKASCDDKPGRLCNGEIFFIKADVTKPDEVRENKMVRFVTLDDENGFVITCEYKELMRMCKLRHAWARTIHTFQGSEAETIVYVLGDSGGQNWQHVYTAVTRGQKRVYVVGTEQDLEMSIMKKIIPRQTRLCSFVNTEVRHFSEDCLTQSGCTPLTPSQSTPMIKHKPSSSQSTSSTYPSFARNLYTNENGQAHSLQEDMKFSQIYSWSPMNDEPSTLENENAPNHASLTSSQISFPSEESVSGSKRPISDDICNSPAKLLKRTSPVNSPLCSSRLSRLSITSPESKSRKKILADSSSHQKHA